MRRTFTARSPHGNSRRERRMIFAGFADVAGILFEGCFRKPVAGPRAEAGLHPFGRPAVILDGSPPLRPCARGGVCVGLRVLRRALALHGDETYKGGLAAEETEVLFLPGTVEAGGEYYLLLKERLMENLPYRLSSKHSLYEADDRLPRFSCG